jgi:isocitrate dehydrogenase
MDKIRMTTPLVEMDGDEMTRVLWKLIKDELLLPFVDLKTEYFDLGLLERDRSGGGHQEVRGGCKVRDHYTQRPAHGRVQAKGDVEKPERDHPRHS